MTCARVGEVYLNRRSRAEIQPASGQVNHEEAHPGLRLSHGDSVEVFGSAVAWSIDKSHLAHPPRTPAPTLDAQRAQLQRIFGASGDLDTLHGRTPVPC